MTGSGVYRLSRFLLDTRTTYLTDLRTLIEFASAQDLSSALNVEVRVGPFAEIRSSDVPQSARADITRRTPYMYEKCAACKA